MPAILRSPLRAGTANKGAGFLFPLNFKRICIASRRENKGEGPGSLLRHWLSQEGGARLAVSSLAELVLLCVNVAPSGAPGPHTPLTQGLE